MQTLAGRQKHVSMEAEATHEVITASLSVTVDNRHPASYLFELSARARASSFDHPDSAIYLSN